MAIAISSGLIEKTDSFTRNPTASLEVSWYDTLVSGEWFRLDQSLMDSNSLLTSESYLSGETIIEIITDSDAKIYDDESEYVMMLEGYSELSGDSLHYATSDLDFKLDNTGNRFTPRDNKNLLANPGFEDNKTSWNESMGTNAKGYIDEYNVITGIRSYQIYNPNKTTAYTFSDRMEIEHIENTYVYSQYATGSGVATLHLMSFDISNSGVNNITTGLIGINKYRIDLVSGSWNRYSVKLENVPSGAHFLRAMFSSSGEWLRVDNGQVEKASTATEFVSDFIGDELLPKKSVKVSVGFNDDNIDKFSGLIQKITPEISEDTVSIYCYDWVDFLKDKKITSTYYENLRTDQIIANLAGLAGIDLSKMNLEVGLLTISFAWFQEGSIWTYINQISEAEGGIVFFDEEGVLTFYNRDHFNTYPNPVYGFSFDQNIIDFNFEISKDKVKNRIEINAYPKKKLTSKVIYSLDDPISIESKATVEVWGQFNYGTETTVPALNVLVPTLGTDINANSKEDGTGTNMISSISISSYSIFQESIKVNLYNNAATTAYITKFNVTGDPIVTKTRIEVVAEDRNSQSLYDTQTLTIENNLMDDEDYANELAAKKLEEMKDPLDYATIECIGAPFLRVGDIISVQTGLDGTFKNFQIVTNRWQFDGDFMQTLEVQKKVGISETIYYPSNYISTESGDIIQTEEGETLII